MGVLGISVVALVVWIAAVLRGRDHALPAAPPSAHESRSGEETSTGMASSSIAISNELTESRSLLPSKPSGVWTVWTHDESGQALAGCIVHAISEGSTAQLGSTGANGRLSIRALPPSCREICASMRGFCSARQVISDCEPGLVECTMKRGAGISGTVQSIDGVLPTAGAVVLAIPPDLLLRTYRSLDELLASPLVAVATADAGGKYSLAELRDDRPYTVYAVAHGYVPTSYGYRVNAPQAAVDLELAKVFAIRLELTEEDGHLPRAHPRLFGSQPLSHRPLESRAEPMFLQSSEMRLLAGLPREFQQDGTQFDRLVAFTARSASADLGELEVWGQVPGYLPFRQRTVLLALCDLPECPIERVRLKSTTSSWGSLEVSFTGGLTNQLPAPDPDRGGGAIFLVREDGAWMEIDPGRLSDEVRRFEGIPQGRYRVFFQVPGLPFVASDLESKPSSILVLESQPLPLVFDLSGMGAATLHVRTPDGRERPTDGRVAVYQEDRADPYYTELSVERQQRIMGLSSGKYRFQLLHPGTSSLSEPVWIEAGKMQDVDLVVAE